MKPIGGVQPFAELARSASTVVYKGYERAAERTVLLKVLRPEVAADPEATARFEAEARLAAEVEHPNVVRVHGAGRDGLSAYLVAEWVEGMDLRTLLDRAALPPALAVYVLREAARGLAAVHAAGVLHRDLKPANLLVSETGAVKLADFGLASLAPEAERNGGEVRGTLAYLAPEVVRGASPSPAGDLFALGVVLVEALTGRAPFARDTPSATLDAVLHHDPLPGLAADPRVPQALVVLAAQLLEPDPAVRIADAAELVEKLEGVQAYVGCAEKEALAQFVHSPADYVPPSPVGPPAAPSPAEGEAGRPPAPPARRVRWPFVAAGAAVLALAVAAAVLVLPSGAPADSGAGMSGAAAVAAPGSEPGSDPDDGTESEGAPPADVEPAEPPADSPPAAADLRAEVPGEAPAEPPEDEPVAASDLAPDADVEAGPPAEFPPATPPEAVPGAAEAAEPAAPAEGTLVVAAEPWARVSVDGRAVGTTPLAPVPLGAGTYRVTLENPEFPAYSVLVEVEGGAEERLAVSLWDLVGRVALEVRPWARVLVDGAYWDTVPPQDRPLILSPGAHALAFEHPALGTYEVTLRVAAGEQRTLRVNLLELLQ